MKPTDRPAYRLLVACIVSAAFLSIGPVVGAQSDAEQSVVDGVVKTVCQKQIVLLGELPSHGEAHTFDAK